MQHNPGMADSRNKGAVFERDIVKRLNQFFEDHNSDIRCKRNLDQYQTNNLCDIELSELDLAIECKAYKSGWWFAPAWWNQVCEAAQDKTPILVWKFNNKPIRVTLPIYAIDPALPRNKDHTAVVTFDQWLNIVEHKLFHMEHAA
tara:strand:+ start:137 stop:571 length:435 start_codon:yes stop_codon:yes gene_type:complete